MRIRQHLNEVDETYLEHMNNAFSFAGHLLIGAIVCTIHAILPFLFETSASRRICYLHERMVKSRKRFEPTDPLPEDELKQQTV